MNLKAIEQRLRWRSKPVWLKTTHWKERAAQKVSGGTVMQGPFQGVKFPPSTVKHTFMTRLLGTYEKELWSVLESLRGESFEEVAHIGAGDGYYVCGVAKLAQCKHITAYEMNPLVQEVLRTVCQLNSVENISICGLCGASELTALSGKKGFVVMDIEGAEIDVLQPEGLEGSTILVELHPHTNPDLEAILKSRFEPTHSIERIGLAPRTRKDLPATLKGPQPLLRSAMREHRPDSQLWFFMKPKR